MTDHQESLEAPPPSVKEMCEISYGTAVKMVNILSAMWQMGILGKNPRFFNLEKTHSDIFIAPCAYFEASFTFTAAIALSMAKPMCASTAPNGSLRILNTQLTRGCQEVLTTSITILDHQALNGNIAAIEYRKLLKRLEKNLNDLNGGGWGV